MSPLRVKPLWRGSGHIQPAWESQAETELTQGERGCSCIGLSADIWKKKKNEERKKGENPKKSVVLEGYITRLPLSYDPPPFPIIHPLPSTHKLEVRVCARKFAYGPPPPPPPPPLDFGVCLGWCSLRGWGVRACTVNYLCGPGMEESGQGCIWRSSFYPTHESVLSVIPGMPTLRRCIDNIKQGKRWKWAYLCRYLCKTKCLYEPDNACFATQWGFKRWHDQFPDLLECKPLFGNFASTHKINWKKIRESHPG